MIKVVIQCSGRKREDAGTFSMPDGNKVRFVAHPQLCKLEKGVAYFRPDDMKPGSGETWREHLAQYNRKGRNQDGLLKAGDLYKREIYRLLAQDDRWETYILSAGWGLVRADFLLPPYDITFSHQTADKWKVRGAEESYNDFNHLKGREGDTVYLFGGVDYLEPFYRLSQGLPARKVIYHRARNIDKRGGYEYIKYGRRMMTNWHYKCAEDFINGRIRA